MEMKTIMKQKQILEINQTQPWFLVLLHKMYNNNTQQK